MLTREAVAAEGVEGGFSGVYPILRALEEAGRIRRGYFVDGLGAAQFALAGALDRLRAVREPASEASADRRSTSWPPPTRPTRTARPSPWPRRGDDDRRPFQRAAGAYVVLVDGVAALYLERGGSTLQTLARRRRPGRLAPRVAGLAALVTGGRLRELVIRKVDGVAGRRRRHGAGALLDAGFVAGYRGLTLRGRGDGPARS